MADEKVPDIPPEVVEKLTELGEQVQSIDIGTGEFILFLVLLFVGGGFVMSFLGMIIDMVFMVFEGIFFAIKWSFKGAWWAISGTLGFVVNLIDDSLAKKRQDTTRKPYDSPGVVGNSQCKLDEQEVKKGKRSKFFEITDEGDIFDGQDDFSDFD